MMIVVVIVGCVVHVGVEVTAGVVVTSVAVVIALVVVAVEGWIGAYSTWQWWKARLVRAVHVAVVKGGSGCSCGGSGGT